MSDEPEPGWAGGLDIELGNERPSTGLGVDPGARKWILVGVGAACLVAVAFVLLVTHDVAPAHAAAIELASEPSSERESTASEAAAARTQTSIVASRPIQPDTPAARSARPSRSGSAQPSSKADSTLAAGSSAAAQAQPRASATPTTTSNPKPPASNPKPAAAPPTPAVAPKPTAKPADTPKPAPKPAPVETPESTKLPSEPMPENPNGELPDVEGWDDADDEASHDDSTVLPPPT